jgi:hypothetical protein
MPMPYLACTFGHGGHGRTKRWPDARAQRDGFAISWETDLAEYILLMHDDALDDEKAWEP